MTNTAALPETSTRSLDRGVDGVKTVSGESREGQEADKYGNRNR
jgi:hypothetical protein